MYKLGQRVIVTNRAVKKRLTYIEPEYIDEWDDALNWDEFPVISEIIDHHVGLGMWPLNRVEFLTRYQKEKVKESDAILVGIRYLNEGVTGDIAIQHFEEESGCDLLVGYRKFIPIYNHELWLVADSLRSKPYLIFPGIRNPRMVFDGKKYRQYCIPDNIGMQVLCPTHATHRQIWDKQRKTYACDLCNAPLHIDYQSQLPF